jgi:hypothetical protein
VNEVKRVKGQKVKIVRRGEVGHRLARHGIFDSVRGRLGFLHQARELLTWVGSRLVLQSPLVRDEVSWGDLGLGLCGRANTRFAPTMGWWGRSVFLVWQKVRQAERKSEHPRWMTLDLPCGLGVR